MTSRVNSGKRGLDETDSGGVQEAKKAKQTEDVKDPLTYPKDASSMPSPDFYDESYSMKTEIRGNCVIINNEEFEYLSKMQKYPRTGTDKDADMTEKLFTELGFTVRRENNKNMREMKEILSEAANADYSKLSAFVCIILSHGEKGKVYATDGTLEISELTSMFRGSNLAGKPKLFFIQACRGTDHMGSVVPNAGGMVIDGKGSQGVDISLPLEADFLYAHSTVPGYYAWRAKEEGSWFIQAIVKVFRDNAHKMDVLRMLTRVNDIVSKKKSATEDPESNNKRQISSITTQLRKELYLFPINGPLKSLSESIIL